MQNLNNTFRQFYLSRSLKRRGQNHHDMHAPKEFRFIVNRERARSDRTGVPFSIVVFLTNHENGGKTTALELIRVVRNRIRFIDELGWLDVDHVGIILPQATSQSARMLAKNICQDSNLENLSIKFEVHTYPSDGVDESEGNPPRDSYAKKRSQGRTLPKKDYRERDIKRFESLHPLFVRKLPLWKRGLDLFAAALGFLLFFPLFMFIALTIKIFSPGPVFFKQERVGYLGRPFDCWKFRTMTRDPDITTHQSYMNDLINSEKPMEKLDDIGDSRIIPFGRFLRQTGLDELPQLFNVFRGDMSLVGPRPCLFYEAEKYKLWQTERFDTLPGLTGLWQVSGKNKTTFREMLRLDINYTKKMSFLIDLGIILRTPKVLITQAIRLLFNKKDERYAEGN